MSQSFLEFDSISLPGDLLRSAESGGSLAVAASRSLDGDVLAVVAERAERLGVGVGAVLEVSTLVALADHSGSREVRVGGWDGDVPVDLSVALREEDTLRSLVGRVRRGASGQPCPVVVAVTGTVDGPPAAEGVPVPGGVAPAEVVVAFTLGAGAGRLAVHHATDLYEAAGAGQLAEHVVACLDALVADPEQPVVAAMRPGLAEALGFLPVLEPAPDPDELFVPGDLVRSWVDRTPHGTAILDADGTALSYAGLGALADGLARRLDAMSEPGSPVAVLTSDSRTAAVAMVACQFADRCFVVLDPDVPQARTLTLLEAAGCRVLLYDPAAGERAAALAAASGLPALAQDHVDARDGDATPRTPGPRVAGDAPAYVAFTSGSTGTPKGVAQPHRSFAQFLAWQQGLLGLRPGSRVAMWSAPVFDACSMEVFGALAHGATLCVPPWGERRDPEVVAGWLSAAEVTFFQGIPSFVEYVVAALERQPRPMVALENVIVAGEVFPPGLAGRMRAVFPSARLHNMFGPTECVLATRYEIPADHPGHRRMPVGRPISGRRIVLLDAAGRPVPRGAVGEIGIVSRFLASGYVGDEAQTRERFRPLGDGTDERVYHTGDFGRIGPDGALRYLGRRDAQIKVRGIRVNLDEVEGVLADQPGVGRCKVVDVRVAAGHVQLVAVVQPEGGVDAHAPDHALAPPALASAWRRSVGEALGARVAPTRYLVVRHFPRTATGKPDLRRMRQINEELRATADDAAPGPTADLRQRVRWAARQVAGRAVTDDESLLARAGDPLLTAVRLKKALLTHCPGVFETVDVRAHASVDALVDTASRVALTSGTRPAHAGERHTTP